MGTLITGVPLIFHTFGKHAALMIVAIAAAAGADADVP